MSDKCDKWDFDPKNCRPDPPVTQFDELVKDARTMAIAMDKTFKDSNAANTWRAVANALESQSAELARLRERNAELENTLKLHAGDCMSLSNEIDQMRRNAEDDVAALVMADTRIASLEATVLGLREALELYREAVRIAPTMEGPRFAGANTSALRRAWEHDRAASESVVGKSEGEENEQ